MINKYVLAFRSSRSIHLVGVSLVDEVLLALRARDHLMSVPGDESIEEGFPAASALGPKDAAHSLCLLSPPAAVTAHLTRLQGGCVVSTNSN